MISLSTLDIIPYGQAVGWTIVHSLWQLALAGLVLRMLLFVLPQKLANLRYLLLAGGLLLATAWSVNTFFREFHAAKTMVGDQETAVYRGIERAITPASSAAVEPKAATPVPPPAPGPATGTTGISGRISALGAFLRPYIPAIAYSWYFGVLLFSAYLIFGFFQLDRLLRKNITAPDEVWRERFEQLKHRMGIRREVVFSLSGRIAGPITFHWFKPVVLAPVSIFTRLTPDQIEILLLHELAHIRRYDYPVNVVQSLVEILFFYHPAVWWISGKIREEREHACDDLVLRTHHAPMLYAEALTQLQLFHHPLKMKLAMTAIGKKNSFSRRIFRLFGEYDQKPSLLKGSMIALLLMISLLAQAFFMPENMAGKEIPEEITQISNPDLSVVPQNGEAAESPVSSSTVNLARENRNEAQQEEQLPDGLQNRASDQAMEPAPLPNAGEDTFPIAPILPSKNPGAFQDGPDRRPIYPIEERIVEMNNDDPCMALLQAVKNKDIEKVKALLQDTDPNCTHYEAGEPRSPLVAAARLGYLEVGKLLVEAKADIEFHARGDETPLMAAAGRGHLDFVKYLVELGAPVNTKLRGDGTALLVAAAGGHLEVMRYLIGQKVEIDAGVEGDGTPLIVAVKGNHLEAAKLLLENGADPFKVVPGDEYAMYHARVSGNKAMIALLKQYEDANSR